ncbi:MAG: deoxyribonuclease V [Candidatus Bathyarchaeia archaeon]
MFDYSNLSLKKAKELQLALSKHVIPRNDIPSRIGLIAGVDVAYINKYSVGAVAVFDYDSMKPIEEKTSVQKTSFPYIPTLLSFRELPPAASAIRRLRIKPDIFLVDGQGYAHPRHFGFACHLGIVLDAPTIGVAKSLLCGKVEDNENDRWKPIIHEGELIGGAVFTKPSVKPVYVSVGHKVSLETAVKIVLHCATKYRFPEPLREAHLLAEQTKNRIADDKS